VLLSLMTTGAESADGWQLLLDDLTTRKMGRPRLVISDGTRASSLDSLDTEGRLEVAWKGRRR
jgi:transposase-like protein